MGESHAAAMYYLMNSPGIGCSTEISLEQKTGILGCQVALDYHTSVPERWHQGINLNYAAETSGLIEYEVHDEYETLYSFGAVEMGRNLGAGPFVASSVSGSPVETADLLLSAGISERIASTDPQGAIDWLNNLPENDAKRDALAGYIASEVGAPAIPEPSAGLLLILSAGCLARRHRSR